MEISKIALAENFCETNFDEFRSLRNYNFEIFKAQNLGFGQFLFLSMAEISLIFKPRTLKQVRTQNGSF